MNVPSSLYMIELVDTAGDGICCGEYGNGWVTLTDQNKAVLWKTTGDYGFVAAVYLWMSEDGEFTMQSSTNKVAVVNATAIDTPSQLDTPSPTAPPVDVPIVTTKPPTTPEVATTAPVTATTPRPTNRPTPAPVTVIDTVTILMNDIRR